METLIEQAILDNYQNLYYLAFQYVKNQQDAMDIVQDSVYKAIKQHKKLKDREYVKSWLWKITRNTALDFLKNQHCHSASLETLTLTKEDHYLDIDLYQALDHLNETERTIVTLKYFDDFKIEQIADILNENINTIKSKLYRALKKMKIELDVEDQI